MCCRILECVVWFECMDNKISFQIINLNNKLNKINKEMTEREIKLNEIQIKINEINLNDNNNNTEEGNFFSYFLLFSSFLIFKDISKKFTNFLLFSFLLFFFLISFNFFVLFSL